MNPRGGCEEAMCCAGPHHLPMKTAGVLLPLSVLREFLRSISCRGLCQAVLVNDKPVAEPMLYAG